MKFLHIIGAMKPGGAETFYVRFVRALAKRHDVLPVVRQNSWIHERLKEEGIKHVQLPFGGTMDICTKRKIQRLITEFKPDIVQGWMNRGCKFIPKTNVVTVGRLGGYYSLKYYKNCDHLYGNTEDIKDYLIQEGIPQDHAHYVPNFTDFPLENMEVSTADTRAEYHLPEGAKVLLVAGRLHENKGIDVAIRALKKLEGNVHLLIAGNDGGKEDELKALACELGLEERVHFIGWVSDITKVASVVDVWLVPSRWEPLGNTVLDAWVHRIPCVATASKGPEKLIENGVNGFLIPLEDDDAMADRVQQILSDTKLAEDLGQHGYKTAKESFSEEVVMNLTEAFYTKLLK